MASEGRNRTQLLHAVTVGVPVVVTMAMPPPPPPPQTTSPSTSASRCPGGTGASAAAGVPAATRRTRSADQWTGATLPPRDPGRHRRRSIPSILSILSSIPSLRSIRTTSATSGGWTWRRGRGSPPGNTPIPTTPTPPTSTAPVSHTSVPTGSPGRTAVVTRGSRDVAPRSRDLRPRALLPPGHVTR